jgi:proteic killer suppression protein
MIRGARDRRVIALMAGRLPKGFPADLAKRARVVLAQLDAAGALDDMRIPPGTRLELLRGDRAGQCSVRINDQWRLCLTWRDGDAHEVESVDDH